MSYTLKNNMDKCIVISYPTKVKDEMNLIHNLFEWGLEYFHLRKPGFSEKEMEKLILRIPKDFYPRIILHAHYNLVRKYQLKGIHITQKTKDAGFENAYSDFHVSISSHSFDEIANLRYDYQYTFLSPLFNSISKSDYSGNFNMKKIEKFLSTSVSKIPVIALGGISPENLDQVRDAGFRGFAVLGAIWEDYIEHENMNRIKKSFLTMQEYIN
jgi:thiamine-phosphate pyrophosphorylase